MKNLDDHSWFTVGFCLVKGRTLLKELIRERARRDLDKNSFESNLITELLMTYQHNSTAEHFLMFFHTRGWLFRLVLVGKLLFTVPENRTY